MLVVILFSLLFKTIVNDMCLKQIIMVCLTIASSPVFLQIRILGVEERRQRHKMGKFELKCCNP